MQVYLGVQSTLLFFSVCVFQMGINAVTHESALSPHRIQTSPWTVWLRLCVATSLLWCVFGFTSYCQWSSHKAGSYISHNASQKSPLPDKHPCPSSLNVMNPNLLFLVHTFCWHTSATRDVKASTSQPIRSSHSILLVTFQRTTWNVFPGRQLLFTAHVMWLKEASEDLSPSEHLSRLLTNWLPLIKEA